MQVGDIGALAQRARAAITGYDTALHAGLDAGVDSEAAVAARTAAGTEVAAVARDLHDTIGGALPDHIDIALLRSLELPMLGSSATEQDVSQLAARWSSPRTALLGAQAVAEAVRAAGGVASRGVSAQNFSAVADARVGAALFADAQQLAARVAGHLANAQTAINASGKRLRGRAVDDVASAGRHVAADVRLLGVLSREVKLPAADGSISLAYFGEDASRIANARRGFHPFRNRAARTSVPILADAAARLRAASADGVNVSEQWSRRAAAEALAAPVPSTGPDAAALADTHRSPQAAMAMRRQLELMQGLDEHIDALGQEASRSVGAGKDALLERQVEVRDAARARLEDLAATPAHRSGLSEMAIADLNAAYRSNANGQQSLPAVGANVRDELRYLQAAEAFVPDTRRYFPVRWAADELRVLGGEAPTGAAGSIGRAAGEMQRFADTLSHSGQARRRLIPANVDWAAAAASAGPWLLARAQETVARIEAEAAFLPAETANAATELQGAAASVAAVLPLGPGSAELRTASERLAKVLERLQKSFSDASSPQGRAALSTMLPVRDALAAMVKEVPQSGTPGIADARRVAHLLATIPASDSSISMWRSNLTRTGLGELDRRIAAIVTHADLPFSSRIDLATAQLEARTTNSDNPTAIVARYDNVMAQIEERLRDPLAAPAVAQTRDEMRATVQALLPKLDGDLPWHGGTADLPAYRQLLQDIGQLDEVRRSAALDPQLRVAAGVARAEIDTAAADVSRYIDFLATHNYRNEQIFPSSAQLGRVRSSMRTLEMLMDELPSVSTETI